MNDSRNWSGLTLAEGLKLSVPMVPDEDDTISMPAIDNPSILSWQANYQTELALPGGRFAVASVMKCGLRSQPKPWSAYCDIHGGEGGESFTGWFATAEGARAAVEEHIAAHVEAHLSEVAR